MNGVLVGNEICWSGHFGESAGEELVVVQVVDDEEEALEAGVGLGEELGVAHQLRDGDIGKLREELLGRRMELKVSLLFYSEIVKKQKWFYILLVNVIT